VDTDVPGQSLRRRKWTTGLGASRDGCGHPSADPPAGGRGYVEVESVGPTKQVTVTETGENAMRAFRHKLRT
jgi:hypothetical protein